MTQAGSEPVSHEHPDTRLTARAAGRRPMRDQVRVMIVDDSLTARTVFARMLRQYDDFSIVASVGTAEKAIETLSLLSANVILLDLEMPGIGGLEALPKIQQIAPSAQVLVVSSLTADGAEHTLAALAMGAADTMLKPASGGFTDSYRTSLIEKIRALGGTFARTEDTSPHQPNPPVRARAALAKSPRAVVIGASTGGIHSLGQLLRHLPAEFDLPIFVTQHLPTSFMSVFANQIEQISGRKTMLSQEGTIVARNRIIIAAGDGHLTLHREGSNVVTGIDKTSASSGCRPSVDPMFATAAQAYDGRVAAIMLSGMGCDGLEGAREIVRLGGAIYVQSAETSAVWGMPGAVVKAGLASAVLPPEELAGIIGRVSTAPSLRTGTSALWR